jgi:type I restriction enzyme S subunit
MNAELLLKHFDRISEAPDAVTRLRRFILDLAVRGKLVEQDPNDEPAAGLLKRIEAERARLVNTGSIKKSKTVLAVTRGEHPFNTPAQWQFVRLGQVLGMINGRAFKPNDWLERGLPIVRIQNLNNSQAPFNYCDPETIEERHLIRDDDFLISWSGTPGTSFGAFIWKRGPAALNQHIFRCIQIGDGFEPDFLRLAINSQLDVLISQAQGGVGLQHVTKGTLEALPLPLPPRAEQRRIVAKVDELMELCDQFEAARNECEARRDRLLAASLNRIGTAPVASDEAATEAQSAIPLPDAARFHLDRLTRLTTRPEHIKQLRQTILNLAVRGRLVPQDPNDEPAAELLKWIGAEMTQLVKDGERKKGAPLPDVDLEQAPFDLPLGWSWARFPELGIFGRGKSKHRPRNDVVLFDGGTHPLIQTGDVARSKGVIRTYTNKYNDTGLAQSMKWPAGTLCITIAANIADSGILSFDACFPDSVVGFIPASMFKNARYFEYFMRTAKANLLEFAPATAQKNINLEILNAVLIPIPPLAEQDHIVAKVDELMDLCDQLEVQLTATLADSGRLLEAALHEALAPAMEQAA